MASTNFLTMPLKVGENRYGIPFLRKAYTGGNNLSKTFVAKLWNDGTGILHGDRALPLTLDVSADISARFILSGPVAGASGEKVRLEFCYFVRKATESEDPSSWDETVAGSVDVSSWSAKTQYRSDLALTKTNFEAGDFLTYRVRRIHDHADDNYAQILTVHKVVLVANF
jgi:hypothetical protein